jgi:hypothetical protein
MIRRLALCLTLIPAFATARTAHPPPPDPAPSSIAPPAPPAQCEAAIAGAEGEAKLPARLLTAIAMRESARPWPWTINYEGIGHFYASKAEAIAAVQGIQATGGQSIDVGCMQINLMHHPQAFANLDEAFDPKRNAAYGGRFVGALFASRGDWGTAIAAYHSRTPGIGEPYRDQVVATWKPKDPAVLAKLSFQPLPMPTGPIPGLPLIYAPFAEAGPIRISANMAYRAFLPAMNNYRSFRPSYVVYNDFGGRRPTKATFRPIDFRLDQGLVGSGRALVAPKGVLVRPNGKPLAAKPAAHKSPAG